MAFIVRDSAPFVPQANAPLQGQQDPTKASRAAGWLQLANAIAASPLTGALIRGGQAVKHTFDESAVRDAMARKTAREAKAIERGSTLSPLAETGGGFTLQPDREGESFFGKGALSQEPAKPSWITGEAEGLAFGSPDKTPEVAEPAPASRPEADEVWTGRLAPGPADASPPQPVAAERPGFPAAPDVEGKVDAALARPFLAGVDRRAVAERLAKLSGGAPSAASPAAPPPEPSVEAAPDAALLAAAATPPPSAALPEDEVVTRGARTLARLAARRAMPAYAGAPDYRHLYAPDRADLAGKIGDGERDAADIHAALAPEDGALAVPMETELARDTPVAPLRLANDPALAGIESKPPELLQRAVEALEASGSALARSRAEAIRQELRRREQEAMDAEEAAQAREDDETLANETYAVGDVIAAARQAHTSEEQAKVLAMVDRARIPYSSLNDLISGDPEAKLRNEVRATFPTAPKKSPEEVAAEIGAKTAQAHAAEARAELLQSIKDPRVRAYLANAALGEEKAETEEALRNEREEAERAKADQGKGAADLARARADEIRQLADDREKLVQAQAFEVADRANKWRALAKRARAGGKGGGLDLRGIELAFKLRGDDLKFVTVDAPAAIKDAKSDVDKAQAAIDALGKVAPAGAPPRPTAPDADRAHRAAAATADERLHADWQKRDEAYKDAQVKIRALTAAKEKAAQRAAMLRDESDKAAARVSESWLDITNKAQGALAKKLGATPPPPSAKPVKTAPVSGFKK